jgi:phosphate transport system permease protein
MNTALYQRRKLTNTIGVGLSMFAMALGLFVLLWILFILFKNGIAALDWAMFTQSTPAPGSEGGGLANAIVGSLMIVGFSTLISTPVGIFAGIYLAEYGDESKTAAVTRFVTDIMLSAPSIILGLFIYAILVAQVKHFSGWAGSLALKICCAWYLAACAKPHSHWVHHAGKLQPWSPCVRPKLASSRAFFWRSHVSVARQHLCYLPR